MIVFLQDDQRSNHKRRLLLLPPNCCNSLLGNTFYFSHNVGKLLRTKTLTRRVTHIVKSVWHFKVMSIMRLDDFASILKNLTLWCKLPGGTPQLGPVSRKTLFLSVSPVLYFFLQVICTLNSKNCKRYEHLKIFQKGIILNRRSSISASELQNSDGELPPRSFPRILQF